MYLYKVNGSGKNAPKYITEVESQLPGTYIKDGGYFD
jgi:hypothetical protein